jgi:hypothetical protein
MRSKLYIVASLIGGIVFTFFAVNDFSSASGDVDCGGETMAEGDECMTFGEDGGVRGVEEQRDAYRSSAWKNLAWAGGLFAAAGGLFYLERRRQRDQAGASSSGAGLPSPTPPPPAG